MPTIYSYLGLCISGTEEIIGSILAARLPDLSGFSASGGAVRFSTAVPYSDLNLFCFNNLFRIIYSAQAPATASGLENFLRLLPSASIDWSPCREHPKKYKSFRLVTSCRGQLVSVSKKAKTAVEQKLQKESGLRPDRSLPDSEFWAVVRNDGNAYLLKRLTRHRAYDKLLAPGELHPELAYMLCWLSNPKPSDVVLDPFCGHGAIPSERARRFPFSQLYAFDLDGDMVAAARQKLPSRQDLLIKRQDALSLSAILPPESVDAVITDPPWGLYRDTGMELSQFYRKALREISAVLKPEGRLVLLTAAKDVLISVLDKLPSLTLLHRYDILVSGKKAGIFLMERKALDPGRSL